MISPFRYPKIKHLRTQLPPQFNNYRRYKPVLKVEFSGQCVYCRALDSLRGEETFGVDHYRPKKLYPALEVEYFNLYYACNRCNSLKGGFWPSLEQSARGHFVPNPCEHVMFEHLKFQGGAVQSSSPAGDWTVEKLLLNDSRVVAFRNAVIQAHSALLQKSDGVKKTISFIERKLLNPKSKDESELLTSKLANAQRNLSELEAATKQFEVS